MEIAMGDAEDLYFLRFEHRPLTPEQWDRLTRSVARRAHEERAQALRGAFAAIRALGSRAAAAARRHWRSYATWRERRQAIKELGGLDDRVLKDMGVHRSEIESVVYGPDSSRLTEGKVAAFLYHKPYARRRTATKGTTRQLTERSAA
jgi:uncharacterized protein YjiS (DUF1127 family)